MIFLKKGMDITSASMLGAFIIAFHIAFTIQNFVACPENVINWEGKGCKLLYKGENRKKRYKSKWLYWSRSQ